MKEMIKKLQKRSNKKGFTLVEIIVVLVILAILAAIAVPAVLGYVNDAKESKYIQEARSIYIVVQTEEARYRADNDLKKTDSLVGKKITYTNKDGQEVKDADFYSYVAYYAGEKTELTGVTIKTTDSKTYTMVWQSDKYVQATLKSNSDVKINKTSKTAITLE